MKGLRQPRGSPENSLDFTNDRDTIAETQGGQYHADRYRHRLNRERASGSRRQERVVMNYVQDNQRPNIDSSNENRSIENCEAECTQQFFEHFSRAEVLEEKVGEMSNTEESRSKKQREPFPFRPERIEGDAPCKRFFTEPSEN